MKNSNATMNRLKTVIANGQLSELISLLDAVVENNSETILLELNRYLASRETVSVLIRQLLDSDIHFDALLRESYYHENGFHKLVLLSGKNFKLRLHHFGASARIPMENIHDHRWAFASSILYGDLKMDLFERAALNKFAADGEEVYHFNYNSQKVNGAYHTEPIGKCKLVKIESRNYKPGSSYLMKTHELHRIKNAPGQESITLILTGKPVSVNCNLYSRKKSLDKEKQTKPYAAGELHCMLLDLASRIEQCDNVEQFI